MIFAMADDYPDKDLVDDFSNGSKAAFDVIFDRYFEKLYIFSFRLTQVREEAEDIASQTLTKLWLKHKDFDNYPQVQAFLYITTRNASLSYLRYQNYTEKSRKVLAAASNESDWVNDSLDADLIEAVHLALRLVEGLPPRSRQVVEMYYLNGMKYREIAEKLDISVRTVENLLRYALDKLRAALAGKKLTALCLVQGSMALAYVSRMLRLF